MTGRLRRGGSSPGLLPLPGHSAPSKPPLSGI